MDQKSVILMAGYLMNRHQRVKVNGTTSAWDRILKGVPQGSILGPIIFNVFINDVFLAIKDGLLFNYADDNTILVTGKFKDDVIHKLNTCSHSIIDWCTTNQMEANPGKFQVMIAEESDSSIFQIDDRTSISTEKQVTWCAH